MTNYFIVIPANDCMDAGGRATQEQLPMRESSVDWFYFLDSGFRRSD
jgi:hypothetical protein